MYYSCLYLISECKMYGWERLSRACGLSCKMLWPWGAATSETLPYDAVNKDDTTESIANETVTSEPQRPVWADLQVGAPIVKNKSSSVLNIKTESYERLTASTSKLDQKTDNRKASLKSLRDSGSSSVSSSAERLEVCQMVTVVWDTNVCRFIALKRWLIGAILWGTNMCRLQELL